MEKYIELECTACKKLFSRLLKQYKRQKKVSGEGYTPFCSRECESKFKSKKQTVSCDNCGLLFEKSTNQIVITQHNFCSRSCAATFNNKLVPKHASDKIKPCVDCSTDVLVKGNVATSEVRCVDCRKIWKEKERIRKELELETVYCAECNTQLIPILRSKRRYCDPCRKLIQQEHSRNNAAKSVKRSKNEIYFAELCTKQFPNVTTNEQFFKSKYGNWDADVILHDHKVAVLWNGIWHYKQVRKKHSLAQVQSRDKIKMDVIKDNGYYAYVIADMGKFNPKFVEQEFEKLKRFIEERQS